MKIEKIRSNKKEKKNPFMLSTPYLLTYTDKSLFTPNFMKQVKKIIGNIEAFNFKSAKEREEVQTELEDLYNVETR